MPACHRHLIAEQYWCQRMSVEPGPLTAVCPLPIELHLPSHKSLNSWSCRIQKLVGNKAAEMVVPSHKPQG